MELRPGAAEVVCHAESLVAVEAGVQAGVAVVRRLHEAGSRTTLAMIRLTGEGVAFLCAHERWVRILSLVHILGSGSLDDESLAPNT